MLKWHAPQKRKGKKTHSSSQAMHFSSYANGHNFCFHTVGKAGTAKQKEKRQRRALNSHGKVREKGTSNPALSYCLLFSGSDKIL
jgi:hypothetical protein